MRLLILGGTVFLGRHLVASALACGHQVTTLNRGNHQLAEQAPVERLIADRETDLSVLAGRTFDAVVDTCGYRPETVRYSVGALGGSVGTYIFISTISVYGDFSTIGLSEKDPIKYTPPGEEGNYGTLKADCEKVISELIPDTSLIIRPGLIAGPFDPTDRFTYWPTRVARGGRIAAPIKPDRLIQFIDVRDLSEWIIRLAEAQERGLYIATGPEERLSMKAFLDACEETVGKDSEPQFVAVEEAALERDGIEPWTELPLWIPSVKRDFAGVMRLDRSKAVAAGLTYRPIAQTIADTVAWDQTRDPGLPRAAGLSEARETALLRQPNLDRQPGRGPLPGAGLR